MSNILPRTVLIQTFYTYLAIVRVGS